MNERPSLIDIVPDPFLKSPPNSPRIPELQCFILPDSEVLRLCRSWQFDGKVGQGDRAVQRIPNSKPLSEPPQHDPDHS